MNIQDKDFYGLVAQEMSNNIIDTGLMTKASAETDFDEKRSKALYIKMRVADLISQSKQQEKLLKAQTEQEKIRIEKTIEVNKPKTGKSILELFGCALLVFLALCAWVFFNSKHS